MSITVTVNQAKRMLVEIIDWNLECALRKARPEEYILPYLEGTKGIGKTEITRQAADLAAERRADVIQTLAKELGCEPVFQKRTTIVIQYESVDFAGVPWVAQIEGRPTMIRAEPAHLPMRGIGVWLLDEVSKVADPAMHNVLAQLFWERRLGEFRVSPGFSMVATGNLRNEKTGDRSFPPHVWDRITPLTVEASLEEWIDWAIKNNVNPTVIFFIKRYPTYFNKIEQAQVKNCTSRGLTEAAKIISSGKFSGQELLAMLVGQIGEAAGVQLHQFLKIKDELEDPEWVLENPDAASIPSSREALYALMAALSMHVKRSNVAGFDRMLQRIESSVPDGRELSGFALHAAVKRNMTILTGAAGLKLASRYQRILDPEDVTI